MIADRFGPKSFASIFPTTRGRYGEFQRIFLTQIYFTFMQAIGFVIMMGLAVGLGVAFQSKIGLSFLGTGDHLGKILVIIIFREIGPIAMSLLLAARSATAVASELATSKVQQELEALDVMGIDVFQYLLSPRIFSGAFALFCMSVLFVASSLLGSWIGTNFWTYLPVSQFITSVAQGITYGDLGFFVLKTTIPGAVIIFLACRRGLSLQKAPFEVPIVTNRAVVDCMFFALMIHGGFSALFYAIYGLAI